MQDAYASRQVVHVGCSMYNVGCRMLMPRRKVVHAGCRVGCLCAMWDVYVDVGCLRAMWDVYGCSMIVGCRG